jgi:hypothetical protein
MELIDMEVQDVEIVGTFAHTVQHQHRIWNRIAHVRVEPQGGRRATDKPRGGDGIAAREQRHVMAQAHKLENLKLALAEGGANLKDVVKVTIYICNPHDVPKARSILQDYFGGDPPASTLCVLRGLANPNFLLEIEAIAAV